MTNLKNIILELSSGHSAYSALVEIVASCGLESVLLSLSEITDDLYLQRLNEINNVMTQRTVNVQGKNYVVPILEYKDK